MSFKIDEFPDLCAMCKIYFSCWKSLLYLCAIHIISSVRRTQVLDDESDYFATDSNQWLSPSEREKLRKKEEELREIRHASRRDRKITLDFAGRRVIEEGNNLNEYYSK